MEFVPKKKRWKKSHRFFILFKKKLFFNTLHVFAAAGINFNPVAFVYE